LPSFAKEEAGKLFIFIPYKEKISIMMKNLGVGSKVEHPRYGMGIVSEAGVSSLKVIFKNGGEREFSLDYDGFDILEEKERPESALTIDDVERALATVLQKFADFTPVVPIAERYRGGTMILKPADEELKAKEIPIDTFFHKIVMVRDRLRVLEQNINKSENLSDDEKVHLQQYITRMYGSLTTFNVLFKYKEDHFVGEKSK